MMEFLSSPTLITAIAFIVVLSLLAGLLPSMEASRLKITDALRKV